MSRTGPGLRGVRVCPLRGSLALHVLPGGAARTCGPTAEPSTVHAQSGGCAERPVAWQEQS